jgi:hypothetical protein
MRIIPSADGVAASADATTTEHGDESVDEYDRYDDCQQQQLGFGNNSTTNNQQQQN